MKGIEVLTSDRSEKYLSSNYNPALAYNNPQ
ncbi:hypothetical protein HDF25_004944 [Pedobacter cryoconitis]|uniref:Uncharacterized protein n=1 Tax=Pedobacter cryoconitis TaxID=188932 RepID=A0A7X0J7Z2_9SPHI|nr:hypothetical protein [Pedobacter cryoconitis]